MARGTVKWFNSRKGYGFIQSTGGGGRDIFIQADCCCIMRVDSDGKRGDFQRALRQGLA